MSNSDLSLLWRQRE